MEKPQFPKFRQLVCLAVLTGAAAVTSKYLGVMLPYIAGILGLGWFIFFIAMARYYYYLLDYAGKKKADIIFKQNQRIAELKKQADLIPKR